MQGNSVQIFKCWDFFFESSTLYVKYVGSRPTWESAAYFQPRKFSAKVMYFFVSSHPPLSWHQLVCKYAAVVMPRERTLNVRETPGTQSVHVQRQRWLVSYLALLFLIGSLNTPPTHTSKNGLKILHSTQFHNIRDIFSSKNALEKQTS